MEESSIRDVFEATGSFLVRMASSSQLVDLPKLDESESQEDETIEHNFKLHTFNSPTFCDVCDGFIWGLHKQGYICIACNSFCVHKRCVEIAPTSCYGFQSIFDSSPEGSRSPMKRTPDSFTSEMKQVIEEVRKEEDEKRGGIRRETVSSSRIKMENLLIERNRLRFKIGLSLEQISMYQKETLKNQEQIQTHAKKKEELLKMKSQLEASILNKKMEIVQKKDTVELVNNIIKEIQGCAESVQKQSSDLIPEFEDEKSLPANVPDVANLDFKLSAIETITSKLEVSLGCKQILRDQLESMKEENSKLDLENRELEQRILELQEVQRDLDLENKNVDKMVSTLDSLEKSFSALKTQLNELNLMEQNKLDPQLKETVDQINKYRQEIRATAGDREFTIKKGNSLVFKDTKEIKFASGSAQPSVKAATINKLIERLTHEGIEDVHFMKAFMATYRSFMKSSELMEKIILRYCVTPPMQSFMLGSRELSELRNAKQFPVRLRVLNVLKYWAENHHEDFDSDQHLFEVLSNFLENTVSRTGNARLAKLIMQTLNKKRTKMMTRPNIGVPENCPEPLFTIDPFKVELGNFTFLELHPLEVARQLALVEERLLKEIKVKEFLNLAWQRPNREELAPNILEMIKHFNKISSWVSSEILKQDIPEKRVETIEKFIEVGKHSTEFRNFNSLFEIIAGLGNGAVQRLSRTWNSVKPEYVATYEEMKTLMNRNYKKYREKLRVAELPCIPYLGILLTDLTFIEEGNPPFVGPNNLINFQKYSMIYNVLSLVRQYQFCSYSFKPLPPLQKWLLSHEELSQEDAYRLSDFLEKKIRESNSK